MQKLILLLGAFALIGCGEKKEPVSEKPSRKTWSGWNKYGNSSCSKKCERGKGESLKGFWSRITAQFSHEYIATFEDSTPGYQAISSDDT